MGEPMAYANEQIAADVAWMEPVIGKANAEWYAEACNVTPDDPNTTHGEVLWACRARVLALILGRDMKALTDAAAELVEACERLDGSTPRVRSAVEAVRKAMWWKE